jgi:excisionase family DNA binding protein
MNTMEDSPVGKYPRTSFMSIEAFAAELGVSFATARRWLRQGVVGSVQIGRRRFVRRTDVEQLAERGWPPSAATGGKT